MSGSRVDNVQTLNNGDTIALGDGDDSLSANLNGQTVTPTSITGVETVSLTAVGGAATVDFENVTGTTSLVNTASTELLTVNDIQELLGLTIENTSSNTVIQFDDTAVAGSDTAVTLNVDNLQGDADVTLGGETDADGGIETVTVNATGSNTFDPIFGTTATAVVLTGSGSLDINENPVFAAVLDVDASEATGDVDLTLAARADADFDGTEDLDVTTNSGDDDINIDAATDDADEVDLITVSLGDGDDRLVTHMDTNTDNSFDGGDGADIIQVDEAMTSAMGELISNFETLEFSDGAITQDMDNVGDINIVNVLDARLAANDLTLNNAADGLVLNLNGALLAGTAAGTGANEDIDEITVNLSNNTAADDVTLNLNAADGDVNVDGVLFDTNYETITITSSGTAENTIQSVDTAINNLTVTGGTDLEMTSTGSLTGVLDASDFTGDLTSTTSTTALTVNSGAGADEITSGLLATGVTQTINGGAGDDTLTGGAIVTTGNLILNGDAGSDTINTAALEGAGGATSTAVVDGGAAVDFITLEGNNNAGQVLQDVVSTASTTANGDVIAAGFTTAIDDFDYNGSLSNETVTTASATADSTDTTLDAALAADSDATIYIDQGNLTGDAATSLDTLADTTGSDAYLTAASNFIDDLVEFEGEVTGLDSVLDADESVLLVFDDGTDSVVLQFTNTDTTTADTMTSDELEVIGVFNDTAALAAGDFI